MKFLLGNAGNVLIVPVFKEDEELKEFNDLFKFVKEKEYFKGNKGDIYSDLSLNGENIIFVGLGEKEKLDNEVLRLAYFNVGKELEKYKIESARVNVVKYNNLDLEESLRATVEGFLHSQYKYNKFLSEEKDKEDYLKLIYFDCNSSEEEIVENAIKETEAIMDGVYLARDLVNEPAMYMTPSKLAEVAKTELDEVGVDVEVFGREKIASLDMKAFLAVAQGSSEEPKFIVMDYKGDPDSEEKLALVGKGLTYDSGGYCIKPPNGMLTMHCDMGGAGAVIGAMKSIAQAGLKKNVVAIVAACENMISGHAYKTGDLIGSMAGKTIEVGNTDAEGRLTLADAIYYAATVVKADKIIDLATLTGAAVVALSNIHTAAITNNDELMNIVNKASDDAGELVWELPNNDLYKELIKSKRADLSNTGKGGAGTITAGLFLEEFVDNKPWVHLDIAGTAYYDAPRGYIPQFATGMPVKTLYYLVRNY